MTVVPTPIQPAFEPASTAGYRAGACNIGPHEIRRRWAGGILGIGAAALLAVTLVAVDAPAVARLAVALPLWGGMVGVLQARRRFCVAFAYAGVANLGEDDDARQAVVSEEARRADRAAGNRIVRDALLVAAPIAALFALLPIG